MPPSTDGQPLPTNELDSVSQGTKELIAQHRPLISAAWVASIVGVSIIFSYFYFVLGDHTLLSFLQTGSSPLLLLAPFILPFGVHIYFAQQARRLMVAQIAQSLGYSYAAKGPLESISGAIFSRGHSKNMYDVLAGTYRDFPIRIFSYNYTVQEGKRSHTYQNTVYELTYPKPLPHIILLPHSLLGLSSGVGLFSGLPAMKKTQLEGDFGTYFDVYVENGAQIPLREILQPDNMQDLIQNFAKQEVEISGTKLYIMQHGLLSTRAGYLALHGLADTLVDQLIPGLRSAAEDHS